MTKILIIGFGGTISMVVDEASKSIVPAKNIQELLEMVPTIRDLATIEFVDLENLDSTNVNPSHWTKLSFYIIEHHDEFDVFIVTHGTNTMAYTASALALSLGRGLKKPVIITGSQMPLILCGTDARFNLENSVKAAVKAVRDRIVEVMIVFSDVILRGSRCVKVSESDFRAFTSPALEPIGIIKSTGVWFRSNAFLRDDTLPFDPYPHFETGVLSVDLTPGQSPDLIREIFKSGKCKGMILKSHGAGSVPSEGEHSFLPLIKAATQLYKIPILVSTKFLGGNAYKEINDAPAVEAMEAGAIPTGDLTDVMAEVKLMWLLSRGFKTRDQLIEEISKDYVGEVTPFWKK
ncbi:asparaginase [Candidatus Woesearchaeota archaeon]|nr:asparaginase [Candidatus Woesearchaeota archaeon]